MKEKVDILFLDGLESPLTAPYNTFITYLFPLAAMMEKYAYSFKILNITTLKDYSLNGMIDCLKDISFEAIGMTTNVDNIRNVHNICAKIKARYPDIPIILGGSQVSFSDYSTLSNSMCDIIVRHEGDETIIKLLDYFVTKKGSLSDIQGITYKTESDIVSNPDAPLV